TVSHLRFGKKPIQSTYLIDMADFVACHNPSYITRYDMLSSLKPGGTFLLNSQWSAAEMENELPAEMKRQLAQKGIKFYNVDAIKLAQQTGMGGRINTVMQSAFFKLSGVIPFADAERYMKEAAKKSYGRKGDKIVQMNYDSIDAGAANIEEIPVPAEWANATTGAEPAKVQATEYFDSTIAPVLRQEGDKLPVSAFDAAGVVPTATTQYEKRGIAVNVPCWISENCIQCNQCSLVCPHAAIRPALVNAEQKAAAPEAFGTIPAIGKEFAGYEYRMQVSPLDCTGCGNCAQVCPGKKQQKALEMKPLPTQLSEQEPNWDYAVKLPDTTIEVNRATVKGSQFLRPLFEFSGACAGCGETPYVKLLSQLFGDRMLIGNATGCSSIYGGSSPTCPYSVNDKGQGPAWANSLFEDNAEFAFGMKLAMQQRRALLADKVKELAETGWAQWEEGKAACAAWIEGMDNAEASRKAGEALLQFAIDCKDCGCDADPLCKAIYEAKDLLTKKSVWAFGGDGWAYDIGYGGLDHVLAQGEDVNILVLDTEVYSNTGGQASKSTPTGSVAKFAAAGKRTRKKDLGLMAMAYGYVYVASVAMGANQAQLLKAVNEAEAYPGPSLIIAYSPCINHGINMGATQLEEKRAVEAGYWPLYRYNPLNENPLTIDSKEPTASYQEFIRSEVRYQTLLKQFPQAAETLFIENENEASERMEVYKKLAAVKTKA
ncbi:MAG: pyruvate:ferredoxin (flavodoxin) oxidoreductase, partial [Oscillospiraceae bacterium]|nr:pyruvate:ferredoxin (flavodoxin) oxidoreductase [Oscillospiraceae bacterium]